MLILAKAAMAMMLGFIIALIVGLIAIPLLKRSKFGQIVSRTISESHLVKDGTPTMGGIIFILPTLISMVILYLNGSIKYSSNLLIVIMVFLAYAVLGGIDDLKKIIEKNNHGLSVAFKFLMQTIIALGFFYIFMKNGGNTTVVISSLGIEIPFGWTYGLFILLTLVGSSNAVNITDGLDGLAGGLSAIAFFAFGLIAWNSGWIEGYQDIAIFSFILVGSLLGFLIFNSHPARVFMGDLGSLSLGAALAAIAIITRHELSLVLIGGVFIVETLSSLIQIIAIRYFHKKVFKMAPLHHDFEQHGWLEGDIVKLFYVVGLILAMIAITYGVWM